MQEEWHPILQQCLEEAPKQQMLHLLVALMFVAKAMDFSLPRCQTSSEQAFGASQCAARANVFWCSGSFFCGIFHYWHIASFRLCHVTQCGIRSRALPWNLCRCAARFFLAALESRFWAVHWVSWHREWWCIFVTERFCKPLAARANNLGRRQ